MSFTKIRHVNLSNTDVEYYEGLAKGEHPVTTIEKAVETLRALSIVEYMGQADARLLGIAIHIHDEGWELGFDIPVDDLLDNLASKRGSDAIEDYFLMGQTLALLDEKLPALRKRHEEAKEELVRDHERRGRDLPVCLGGTAPDPDVSWVYEV